GPRDRVARRRRRARAATRALARRPHGRRARGRARARRRGRRAHRAAGPERRLPARDRGRAAGGGVSAELVAAAPARTGRGARTRASLRRLRTLVVREARATLRDAFTMTTLVAVPLVALLAFGFVLSTEVRGLRLGVVDASASAEGRRIVADLAAGGHFEPVPYASRAAAERALVAGEIGALLVLPPGLARSFRD